MYQLSLGWIDAIGTETLATRYLSPELLATAPKTARRAAWLAGRILVAHATGWTPLPVLPLGPQGKPLPIDTTMPAFNISHSQGLAAVLTGPPGQTVGCDIEQRRPRPRLMQIAQAYFSAPEIQWIQSLAGAEQEAGFWKLWTLREAILKFRGDSVWQMRSLSLSPLAPFTDTYFVQYSEWRKFSIACCLQSRATVNIQAAELD